MVEVRVLENLVLNDLLV